MKRALLILVSIFVCTGTAFADDIKRQDLPVDKMQQQNREIVRLASEELTKTLPQKVDKYTTLSKVEGKDTTLVYVFEINTGAKSDETVKKEDRTRMQKAVTSGICRTSKRFLDADINISYLYISGASKAELFRFNVSKMDCPESGRY